MIKRGILSPKGWRNCRNAVTWLQTRTHNGAKLQIKMGTGGRGGEGGRPKAHQKVAPVSYLEQC